MKLNILPLTAVFAAEVTGARLDDHLDELVFKVIRDALDHYNVLIFRNQPMNDRQQIVFSKLFGPLEHTIGANPGRGSPFARQSNLDINTGELIPSKDRRMLYQKGNMLWHADSTFKKIPSLCSILTAREVPETGGATEFSSTRAAYESLPNYRHIELEDLMVEHSVIHSRRKIGFTFTPDDAAKLPGASHALVQTNPVTGRKSVLIGAHASHIVGWPTNKSQQLLSELLELATKPENCYRHEWQQNDLVIWDNRACLHRATEYNAEHDRRLMQRTTISSSATQTA